MKSIETVGILGLGKMGCPMAGHLVSKGFKVIGYDPRAEARKSAMARGARSAASAREVAHACDVVIIVVGFDSEVR
jgi:3-hydroxyisobutyrate dehydrogenase